jgi:hypothetical protein
MIYESAKQIMEDYGLIKLATHRPKETDLHLWKQQSSWYSDGNSTCNTIYQCPLKSKFGCPCQFKMADITHATYVGKRGMQQGTHDNACHAPEKDKSKTPSSSSCSKLRLLELAS